jgi:hypothetical protein
LIVNDAIDKISINKLVERIDLVNVEKRVEPKKFCICKLVSIVQSIYYTILDQLWLISKVLWLFLNKSATKQHMV